MKSISKEEFINIINIVADSIIENEGYFCDLDSVAGDGDFGTSLAKGFSEIKNDWDNLNRKDIGSFLKNCSMIIMEKCGGASGPIWGNAFMKAGRYAKGKESLNLEEVSELFKSMIDGVQKVGKAKLGDKTLLDSLIPLTESLKKSAEEDLEMEDALDIAIKEAAKGAESTKTITASKGRARYLGERSIGAYDAGAKAIVVIMSSLNDKFFQ
jgi:dihydroxyacetone kinase